MRTAFLPNQQSNYILADDATVCDACFCKNSPMVMECESLVRCSVVSFQPLMPEIAFTKPTEMQKQQVFRFLCTLFFYSYAFI